MGRTLIGWDERCYCPHGRQQFLHMVPTEECSCKASPPPASEAVVRDFIKVVDAIVAAKDKLDWTLPSGEDKELITFSYSCGWRGSVR